MSGLNINLEKTKIIWFGCPRPPETKYMQQMDFEWNPELFSILGVEFSTELLNITDNNIKAKWTIIQRELKHWASRDLTPIGRITIVKSLSLSKIVHLLIALPNPSRKLIKDLEAMLFKFIWKGKPDKVKRNTVKQPFEQGGIDMLDINHFITVIKVSWFRRIKDDSIWKQVLISTQPNILNLSNWEQSTY